MTYTKTSGQDWIQQNSINQRLFSITVNKDPSLILDHTLSVDVSSRSYPEDISVKTIYVPISILCTGPQLVEQWKTPSIWEPSAYDESQTWDLPAYQSCYDSYTDLDYEFYDESGRLDWITAEIKHGQFTTTLSSAIFQTYVG